MGKDGGMKTMKRSSGFVLGLLWLLIADVATAGDYTLVMGKAAAVCQHMLNLFNEDMKNFGELKYDQHEEFTSIDWTLALDDFCWRIHTAQFDIDNDGHEDVVLKHAACIRGILNDSLYIYAEGKNAPKDPPYFTSNVDVLKQASRVIGHFPHGQYDLRKLPKFREGTVEFYRYMGEPFYMNPFRFGGRYYLVLDDPFHFLNKGERRYTAVVQTDKHGNLNDVCYFAIKKFTRRDADVID